MASTKWKSSRIIKRNAYVDRIFIKEETRAHIKKVSAILKKAEAVRTEDDWRLLQQSEDVVRVIRKRTQVKEQTIQRHLEIEDSPDLLQDKCEKLASIIRNAMSLVVYTGAGISTAASIPDYRGPNGVWTLLKQGKQLRYVDLCDADPTLTHMAIVELYKRGYVKHIVSQNCDGLHLRSGLPRSALSELHGNMYIEVCSECQPPAEYVRLFDVTERTAMRRHKTGRRCHKCNCALFDTIVHFGEKVANESPYNWRQAVEAADSADVILCLGSSLKVLKKYACLWGMHKPIAKRPHLFIVNLQWTPKDPVAALKINGRCDHVMHLVMKHLEIDIPSYVKSADPIFALATQLRTSEVKTTTRKMLPQLCSGFSAVCNQGHSEGKRGKGRWFKNRQLSSLPTRVMPSRRAKPCALRAVRISKKPSIRCVPTPTDAENIHDCSGNCHSCSFAMPHAANSYKAGTGVTECSDIETSEDRSSESSQKCFGGCSWSNNIIKVQECLSESKMDRRLQESNATVTSLGILTGSQIMSQRGVHCGQLPHVLDLDRMIGNGTWWDKIDSKTWLEALQAYLLHLNAERMNVTERNRYACAGSDCHFTARNLLEAPPYGTGLWISKDGLIIGDTSGPKMGKSLAETSKKTSSISLSNLQVSADQWKQLDSGETLKRHLEQNCKCDCSTKLADSKEPVSESSSSKCSDEWLSGRLLRNPQNGIDILPCERKLCKGMSYDERALKFCTLSDLKMMHEVLFDSEKQSNNLAMRNMSEESSFSKATVVLPVESKPLNIANLEANMQDVNADAKHIMANADLVRFMHSYCQQEMVVKREPCSPSKPTDIAMLSRAPLGYEIPVSAVGFGQEILDSKEDIELKRTELGTGQLRTELGTEQIRTDQVYGRSRMAQTVTDGGSFHADGEYLNADVGWLHSCTDQRKRYCVCMNTASFNSASKLVGNSDNRSAVVVGLDSGQHVGKSSCLTQVPENCCHVSSRNANANSHVKEQEGKRDFISTPGWFGKGISIRKRKRKSLK